MADSNQVSPNYGPQPKGKANIMRQGQTETNAWGQDPMVEGVAGQVVRDSPDLQMATKSATNAPASVAEGLGNVLRAITDTLTAPDATAQAGPLMKLQTSVLDMIHGAAGGKGQPGAGGGPPPPGGPPGGAPPGAPPAGGNGLMGGLAGMQGAGQGPSPAVGS